MSRQTRLLIADLASNLCAVRRLPRIRAMFATVLAIGAGVGGVCIALIGLPRGLGSDAFSPVFRWVALSLGLMASGALLAALARAIPGRAAAKRVGDALAALGVGAALWAAVLSAIEGGFSTESFSLIDAAHCGGTAVLLGIPALFCAVRFLRRGVSLRPLLGLALACLGAIALSASAVHVVCPSRDPIHLLVGHALAPVLAALGFLAGLVLILEFRFRRSH